MVRFDSPMSQDVAHGLRALRIIIRWLTQLFALVTPIRDDWYRAGNMVCDHCGLEYLDHVSHPIEPWLTILCSGNMVKL